VLVWLFNSLAAAIRGTGNMALPAIVTLVGTVLLVPLSPLLIFGWGPVPALGIAGGALALLLYYVGGTVALLVYLRSPRSLLQPTWSGFVPRRPLFADILRVGLVGAVSTVATNLSIGVATALVGGFGAAAIAGYGTASRLEYLLVPLVFGIGGPLVAMVGTCIGAGQRERALKATWIGAALAFGVTEAIGLAAAVWPHAWLSLFDTDPAMLDAGARATCASWGRSTVSSVWGWCCILRRRARAGFCGRCWATSRGWPWRRAAAGWRSDGVAGWTRCSLRRPGRWWSMAWSLRRPSPGVRGLAVWAGR
jgi:Na+-driven multidrug efflux pump